MLPRIPLTKQAADFRAFAKAGRGLAHWHLNYETIDPYPLDEHSDVLTLDPQRDYLVTKMTYARTQSDAARAASAYAMALLELTPPSIAMAEKLLTRALDLLNSLACSDASDTRNRTDLVRAHTDLGALELIRGSPAAAAIHLQHAIDQATTGPQDKRDRVLLQELARAHEKLGDASASLHDTPAAKSHFKSALTLVQQIDTDMDGMSEAQTRLTAAIAKLK